MLPCSVLFVEPPSVAELTLHLEFMLVGVFSHAAMLRLSRRLLKGDMTFNVLHDCNPQIGAPYDTQDRVMKEDEIQDFLKSVRGWTVLPSGAITRSYDFDEYMLAYEWMGRVMAFGFTSDKYPRLHWEGTKITATVYSGHFKGLSHKEARLAAFMNDHWNMIRKAGEGREELLRSATELAAHSGFDIEKARHFPTVAEQLEQLRHVQPDGSAPEDNTESDSAFATELEGAGSVPNVA